MKPEPTTVLFGLFIQLQAELHAHQILLERILREHPITGTSPELFRQHLAALKEEARSKIMTKMEDVDPATAAMLDALGEGPAAP